MIAMILILSAPSPDAAVPMTCPAQHAQAVIGRRYDEQTRKIVDGVVKEGKVRWIMPGSAVTQDWVPTRLNLDVGDDGRILKVWCG